MHAQLDTARGALGDAQQLDAVAQLFGVPDVGGTEFGNAFDIGLVKLHGDAKRDGRHDRGFMGGVHAFDVKRGVGLGIAQALGFLEHHVKVQPLVAHLGQDEVGGAVDDARDPLDAVGRQALAQRLDDRDAAGDRRLEGHHHALGGSGRKNLGAMHRQQSFVGGDHMLARRDGLQHQRLGDAVAADELDHDVDFGIGNDRPCVVHHGDVRADDGPRPRHIQIGHHGDLDAAAGAALDLLLVAFEHVERAAAHGAYAQQAYLDRFHGN
ncbi:MAG: hypothetical protein BWX79_01137 [Alphaproteobacteria bacterium ADurb.Bin100]|nr:MAG: hypothetical protein BWX79_01137 [Alphaproteobacteria bacterium ADurb.Bin100]